MNRGTGSTMHKACHRTTSRLAMSVTQNAWSEARWSLGQQRRGTTGGSDLTGHTWIPLRAGEKHLTFWRGWEGFMKEFSWWLVQMKTLQMGRAVQSYCFWTKVSVTVKFCEFLLLILKTAFFTVKMSIFILMPLNNLSSFSKFTLICSVLENQLSKCYRNVCKILANIPGKHT